MKADVVLCQGNVLRDYLTDLFPILELGTSAKMRLAWCRASAVGICWYQLIAEVKHLFLWAISYVSLPEGNQGTIVDGST